jgi:hypothetical protein
VKPIHRFNKYIRDPSISLCRHALDVFPEATAQASKEARLLAQLAESKSTSASNGFVFANAEIIQSTRRQLFVPGNPPLGIWYTDKEWFCLSPRPRGINVCYLSVIRSSLSTTPDVCNPRTNLPEVLPQMEVLPQTK